MGCCTIPTPIGVSSPFFLNERRLVFPSMAITSADIPVEAAAHATKHCWSRSGSSAARPNPVGRRVGVLLWNGRNLRSRSSLFSPKRAMSVKVSAPASTTNERQQKHFVERIDHLDQLAQLVRSEK